jgi:ABC-type multidrug transport system fused ATPase/permease subunit
MSFREIAVTVRAVNRASNEFSRIQSDAEALAARIKNLGTVMAGMGAAGTAIGYVAKEMGFLNDEQGRVFNSAMMVVTAMGMFLRTSWGVAVAQKVYSAACWVATAAQNALNISYGTFLALTGVGIAVIVAAAAAMWSFANSMNAATSSVQSFNGAAAETPSHTRSIQRSGDAALYRQGVEWTT